MTPLDLAQGAGSQGIGAEPVWVLDDPRAGTSAQTIGIAERLGVPFRRVPLTWNWAAHVAGLAPHGSLLGLEAASRAQLLDTGSRVPVLAGPMGGPGVVLSAGRRSAAVALWVKAHSAARVVHCMSPGMGGLLRRDCFDLLVIPEHDQPRWAPNVMPVLGAPHKLSPEKLQTAARAWHERLAHLPRPRVAVLLGGAAGAGKLTEARAHELGARVAQMALACGGSVLATTSRRTGDAATNAFATGLSPAMHLLYRWGEPGENPYHGFLALADAIVATAESVSMISEACATFAPVYVALPELATKRHQRFLSSLRAAGQVRSFSRGMESWARPPLDEAGRVAAEILRRFPLD